MEIRTVTDGEHDAFRETLLQGFGEDTESDPDGVARFRALIDPAQVWGAFDGGVIVATAATVHHDVVVPGGAALPMAGLTTVSVRSTHRRRGILRELMRLHLEDARARARPLSGLWASEAVIYGRFGYGLATESNRLTVERADLLSLAPRELDAVEWVEVDRARELLPPIYRRAIADRPGALVRSDAWWREQRFLESPFARGGASKRRHIIARRGGEAVGYVQFRQRAEFDQGLASGKAEIVELIAVDARAAATLWHFMCSIDLFPTVKWWNAPIDDPLALIASDVRRVVRLRTDGMWLRVDDIPRCLAARRYPADGTLRFSVEDATYELAVEGGQGRCAPTTRASDLTLSRSALGMLYLGGTLATTLSRAGVITGAPETLALADRVFASSIAPWCAEVF